MKNKSGNLNLINKELDKLKKDKFLQSKEGKTELVNKINHKMTKLLYSLLIKFVLLVFIYNELFIY